MCLTSDSQHLNQDLKLYACLSETCVAPPQLFGRFNEWCQHMDECHSKSWIEEIHKPLYWSCGLDHNYLCFDDEEEFDHHVEKSHPHYEDKALLKDFGERWRQRPPYTCPICNCVPEELTSNFPWLCEGNIANLAAIETEAADGKEAARKMLLIHIGTHLVQLGLLSAAYFEDADVI